MSWDNDDVHFGSFSEIGESLRGMQDSHVGAARQIAQLKGALGQLAAGRFAGHAPVSKQMRSPYKDSTQIGILVDTGDIQAAVGNNPWLSAGAIPTYNGSTRVYKSFKPTKAILTELVTYTFVATSGGAVTKTSSAVPNAADLVLVQAFAGADNCFPNAPNESNGIAGPTFSFNSLGNGISWPTINGGIDMTVAFGIEESILYNVAPPTGSPLSTIRVKIRLNLMGPSLR